MALGYLLVLLRISPWLLLAAVALAAAISTLQKTLEPRVRAGSQLQVAVNQAISARVVEDYQALRFLHSSGELELADQRLQGLMREMEAAFRGQVRRLALLEPVASFLPILAVAVIEFEFGAAGHASRPDFAGSGYLCPRFAAAQCAVRRNC